MKVCGRFRGFGGGVTRGGYKGSLLASMGQILLMEWRYCIIHERGVLAVFIEHLLNLLRNRIPELVFPIRFDWHRPRLEALRKSAPASPAERVLRC
jgi:hypothetical protein